MRKGFILLLGIVPRIPSRLRVPKGERKPRFYDIYYKPILDELRDLYSQGATFETHLVLLLLFVLGVLVFDSWLEKQVTVRVFVCFATLDLREVPNVTAQMQAPALVGACTQCHQLGCSCPPDKRTVYLHAYR